MVQAQRGVARCLVREQAKQAIIPFPFARIRNPAKKRAENVLPPLPPKGGAITAIQKDNILESCRVPQPVLGLGHAGKYPATARFGGPWGHVLTEFLT